MIIKCQKCGAENRLGQLFCRECGAKLDLNSMNPLAGSSMGHQRVTSGGAGAIIARIVRVGLTVGLLGILGLLCWPATMTGDAPSEQGAKIVPVKMTALRGAILRKNEVTEIFPEADVNAHVTAVLARGPKPEGWLTLHLKQVALDISPETVVVWMKSSLGPLPLTYTADVAVVRRADGRYGLEPRRVRIGHMPLPGPLQENIWRQITSVFRNLPEEAALLSRLPRVQLGEGSIEVATFKP